MTALKKLAPVPSKASKAISKKKKTTKGTKKKTTRTKKKKLPKNYQTAFLATAN